MSEGGKVLLMQKNKDATWSVRLVAKSLTYTSKDYIMLWNQGIYVCVHKSSHKSHIHSSLKEEGIALTFHISIICQPLSGCSLWVVCSVCSSEQSIQQD